MIHQSVIQIVLVDSLWPFGANTNPLVRVRARDVVPEPESCPFYEKAKFAYTWNIRNDGPVSHSLYRLPRLSVSKDKRLVGNELRLHNGGDHDETVIGDVQAPLGGLETTNRTSAMRVSAWSTQSPSRGVSRSPQFGTTVRHDIP